VPKPDWEERYTTGDLPWDTGEPDHHLVDVVRSLPVPPGNALEIGCGTGTNSLWLARQGFNVLGIDVSQTAIEKGRAKMVDEEVTCRFASLDFFTAELPGPFDFVFDRGCYHVFDLAEEQTRFAERVAEQLSPNGLWLSLIGSTEGPERDHGPPRRSAHDIVATVEPHLEIAELRLVDFRANVPTPVLAWLCIARARSVPAQPSTVRT
jgi:SAM-dependent methyltransferase